jgi:poly(3-hydroxybutyrate) depolymerase
MFLRTGFYLLILLGLTVNADSINLRGKITNSAGNPVANAVVTVVKQGLKDTTGADGMYTISNGTPVILPIVLLPQQQHIVIKNGSLEFSLPEPSPIKVEIFNVAGKLQKREMLLNASSGFYRFNIDNSIHSTLLVIKASLGQNEYTFRYFPFKRTYVVNQADARTSSGGFKQANLTAIDDTLKVTATGYMPKAVVITTYDLQQDIKLDAGSSDYHYMGNPAGPSTGCGKDIGSWKSGTYEISSAGLSRRYIIDIPANYDKNHPYRLIFAPHCMCGSMWSVQSEQFYWLKHIADSTKNYCIFVAPSVYNGGKYDKNNWGCPVWDQREKDHTFFDDMLKLFKGEFCIDTTRVFCAGFSYGAMFTNSLAQNHQKVLRAVACYATSLGGGIYVPTNTGEPLAWMGTVGLSDGRCPPSDGRACRDRFLKNNALNGVVTTEKATEVAAGTKSHVVYDYKGVDPRYPVKWCTFDNDHQWSEYDGGNVGSYDPAKAWAPHETWKFFMQF